MSLLSKMSEKRNYSEIVEGTISKEIQTKIMNTKVDRKILPNLVKLLTKDKEAKRMFLSDDILKNIDNGSKTFLDMSKVIKKHIKATSKIMREPNSSNLSVLPNAISYRALKALDTDAVLLAKKLN